MIAGGNWWRENEIVMRHLTRQPDLRYRSRDKAVAANPMAPAQLRDAPMSGLILGQHRNPLFHGAGLTKRHRKSSLRSSLTCQPSTQSKLSGIYPVHTS